MRLGDGWPAPAPSDPVEDETQRRVDLDSLRYEQLMATVNALRVALLEMPAPVVNVSEPDLSDVVNAVNGLRPGATADEIGEAIVSRLGGGEGSQIEPVLVKLTKALETLDFRMKGLTNGNSIAGPLLPAALNSAPASDTGQAALPVRVISQLGAGAGGGAASSVTINDPTVTTQKLAIDASGRVTIANPTANPETGLAKDATLTGGTQQSKITDGTNVVGVAGSTAASSETTVDRLKVNAALRVLDTAQAAGSQLVAAKGDQTSGLWVNVKATTSTPVTGTFWQATQPVSAASLPLPAGAAQDGTDISAPTAMPAGGAGIRGWLSAIWTKLNGSIAVTGTFWQATQPVSGTVNSNQGTANTAANGWPIKITDGSNVAAVKAASTAAAATDPAQVVGLSPNSPLPAGTNSIGTVQQPTLTKGTQGATGVSTQDLKDAGRSAKAMLAAFTSTALTETAISFQVSTAGGAPAAAATSYTVTAGKTLRIQTVLAQIRAGGSVPAASLATFKMKVGGNQQGMAYMVAAPTTVAAGPSAFVGMLSGLNFPDGFEFAAGSVLSFTLTLSAWTAAVNTPIVDLTVVAYEY